MYNTGTIQSQYADTNIAELLHGISEIKQKYIGTALESYKNSMDLTKASGVVLDLWGRLLGFSRYIPISSEHVQTFKNFSFYNRNFLKVKFHNSADIVYTGLSDNAYRLVLQLLLSSRNIQSNVYDSHDLAQDVFGAKVTIGDSMDMQYITYYFKDELPAWLSYILGEFEILPRPCCVGAKYVSAVSKNFGFKPEGWSGKGITSFWNARFADDSLTSPLPPTDLETLKLTKLNLQLGEIGKKARFVYKPSAENTGESAWLIDSGVQAENVL